MGESVTGLRLLSAASSEPQAVPGLPGLWSTDPELSVVPADLGLDLAELQAQAEAMGFEVEEVEWERVVEVEADEPELPAEYADWTVVQLDAHFGDYEGYPADANKPEKVAFAEAEGEG
jgi:hypothetical protein